MRKSLIVITTLLLFCSSAFAASVIVGQVEKIDTTTKTILVKAQDGTEHTFHLVQRTAVQGEQAASSRAKDSWQQLKEGTQVAVHYTSKGKDDTAEEIDHLSGEGMKSSQGELVRIDQSAKTVTIKAEDGSEHVYQLSKNAAEEANRNITETAQKTGKITVYYTEQAGHQVAHFFTKTIQGQ